MKRKPGHTIAKSSMKRMHGSAVQAKTVMVRVTRADIESAECGNPTKCMIKVAVKRALNLSHGYIHVDATGISISRNGSYREKSFLTRTPVANMIQFDAEKDLPHSERTVKPFSFKLHFFKTGKVNKYSHEVMAVKIKQKRDNGNSKKQYNMRSRVIGIAVGGVAA